jgi:hypothetical protein
MFYDSGMSEYPALRLVESQPRRSILNDLKVIRDFTRVCRQVGILDPDTGLVEPPQRDDLEPAS